MHILWQNKYFCLFLCLDFSCRSLLSKFPSSLAPLSIFYHPVKISAW
ncbi:putative signal peptide protein [Puccinia sorghi]|uniref:Putative signal peptide protein n=1 Tax=Puccinia sorghi TaxID=27349 RepID=A0A0L6UTC8_9BASI|nr:putative signal peptide protein [Puccinia sorghi]